MRRLLLLALLVPATAGAYTQTQSVDEAPLHWRTPHAVVHRDPTAPSRQLSDEQVASALDAALASWNHADARVQLEQATPDALPATPVDCYLRFIQGKWSGPSEQLAITQPWVHADTGEIVGAVIEVNEADHSFSVDGTSGNFDLLAVLTHETGHLLGLGHSTDASATMYAATAPGELDQRSLAADDLDGLHSIYDSASAQVVSSATTQMGCSAAPGTPSPSLAELAVLLFALLVFRRAAVRS